MKLLHPRADLLMDKPTPPRAVPNCSEGNFEAGRTLASMDFNMLFVGGGSTDHLSNGDQKQAHQDESSGYDTVTVYIRILRRLTAPRSAFEYQLSQTLKSGLQKLGRYDVGDDAHIQSLKEYLTTNGFAVNVSTTPGAYGSAALLNLRHKFLWIRAPAVHGMEAQQQRIILELDLKAHFIISRATSNYQRLVDALPEHFIGTHRRLVELVEFMSEQMTASFRESGMSIPPWRQPKSILSKWHMSTVASDKRTIPETVTPELNAPEAAYVKAKGAASPSHTNYDKSFVSEEQNVGRREDVLFKGEMGDENNP